MVKRKKWNVKNLGEWAISKKKKKPSKEPRKINTPFLEQLPGNNEACTTFFTGLKLLLIDLL